MNDVLHVIGEVPDDPRVKQAIENYEKGPQDAITKAVTQSPPLGLARYGITLRKPSLMQSAMITRVMGCSKAVPVAYQPFIYIFTLGAPLEKVYQALDLLDDKGLSGFMTAIHTWFDESGIPTDVTQEVLNAVAETFEIANKLMPPTPEPEGDGQVPTEIKKNPSLGSS